MKKIMKLAFTLVEVLITLTVIGVLSMILIPVALHSMPDENVMKFKKADAKLYDVINQLVSSDKYYMKGDLSKKPNKTYALKDDFCNSFADLVNTKKVVCNYENNQRGFEVYCTVDNSSICINNSNGLSNYFDNACKEAQSRISGNDIGIFTTDNINFFEATMNNHFGCIYEGSGNACNYTNEYWSKQTTLPGNGLYGYSSVFDNILDSDRGIKTLRTYRAFCIDIDGINKGEDPFGYGIRADGKILRGTRAEEWMNKSMERKE